MTERTLDELLALHLRELETVTWGTPMLPATVKQTAKRRRAGRTIGLTAAGMAGLSIIVSTGAIAFEPGDAQSGSTESAAASTPPSTQPEVRGPRNILFIGTSGNAREGFDASEIELDGLVLVHLAASNDRVEVLALHPGTVNPRPTCLAGEALAGAELVSLADVFDESGSAGGLLDAAVCVLVAFEQSAGVRVDDIVVTDFGAFTAIADTLGGVPVCLPSALSAPEAHLDLAAGQHLLDGTTLLSLSRARAGTGMVDGTEESRLDRQAEVYAALLRTLLRAASESSQSEFTTLVDQAFVDAVLIPAGSNPDRLAEALWAHGATEERAVTAASAPLELRSDGLVGRWSQDAHALFSDIQSDQPLSSDSWPPCTG
jgi:LCP family protein required for cell wall assembly